MKLKKLLLFVFMVGLMAPSAQAEQEPTLPAFLEKNPAGQPLLPFQPMLDCTSNYKRGDFNGNEAWDLLDAVPMINCLFVNPRGQLCLPCIVDINCDDRPTPVDLILLLRFAWEPPQFEITCPD